MNNFFNNKPIFCKSFIIVSFFIVSTNICFSQVQYFWARQGYGDINGEGFAVASDRNGNSFLTGYYNQYGGQSYHFGSDSLPSKQFRANSFDFLVKFDPNGNEKWVRSATTDAQMDQVQGFAVATDKSNNVYEAGMFMGTIYFGTYKFTSVGEAVYLVKYDSAGNFMWAQTTQNNLVSDNDIAYGVATDTNDNVYITGYFSTSSITFGPYTLNNAGGFNIFLVKFDSNGNPLWAKSDQGNGADIAYSVCVDTRNRIYITGQISSTAPKFGAYTLSGTGYRTFLAKYDESGNVLWVQAGGGTLMSEGNCVVTDRADNVYITGFSYSDPIVFNGYNLTNPNGANKSAYFLTKFDSTGNTLWARSATGGTVGYSLATDKCDDIFVAGAFPSNPVIIGTLTVTVKSPNDPAFIARYDSSGNAISAFGTRTGGDDQCGIATDSYGNILFGGDYGTDVIYGKGTLVDPGSDVAYENGFIAKVSEGNSCCLVKPSLTTCCNISINKGESTSLSVKAIQGTNPTYNWVPATGLSCSTCPSPIASPTVTTMYYVTMVDSEGCSQTDSLLVKVDIETCGELNVPNVFTPNGD